jgi:hypothetical protein
MTVDFGIIFGTTYGWRSGMTKKDKPDKKWWTNGKTNVCQPECPEGFRPGMFKVISEDGMHRIRESVRRTRQGKKYWTDGEMNVLSVESPGPEFRHGMICKTEESRARMMEGLKAGWSRYCSNNIQEILLFNQNEN